LTLQSRGTWWSIGAIRRYYKALKKRGEDYLADVKRDGGTMPLKRKMGRLSLRAAWVVFAGVISSVIAAGGVAAAVLVFGILTWLVSIPLSFIPFLSGLGTFFGMSTAGAIVVFSLICLFCGVYIWEKHNS
jgi:hypothetical protein